MSLELTVRTPQYSTLRKPLGYLAERLANRSRTVVELECVAVEETLAEKVLSFLRRYAQYQAGEMRAPWDTALVRHVYDTHCVHVQDPQALTRALSRFTTLVECDVEEFGRQHRAFADNPRQLLLEALARAETDEARQKEYDQFLLPLVFGSVRPQYRDAYGTFKECADSLLSTL